MTVFWTVVALLLLGALLILLPPLWRTVTLANPIVYLVNGFRWSFYGVSDVSVGASLGMTLAFLAICMTAAWWIFRTGYRLKA